MAQSIAPEHTSTYVLGHSPAELKRLDAQGKVLRSFTERLLSDAGIGPGMRVLDAGCGTGDVSVLAAERVGPQGSVVGIDRSPEALATARARAEANGLAHLTFEEVDLTTYEAVEPYDAVVGRLILSHQPHPAAAVRQLARQVRPGGVIAFAELVLLDSPVSSPQRPEFLRLSAILNETLRRSGFHLDMGLRLFSVFQDAGLPAPQQWLEGVIIPGADYDRLSWPAEAMRSLVPAAERTGVVTAAEIGIDTMIERLLAEAEATGEAVCSVLIGGAWTTVSWEGHPSANGIFLAG
jgi:SAM-dependent methyltransferase